MTRLPSILPLCLALASSTLACDRREGEALELPVVRLNRLDGVELDPRLSTITRRELELAFARMRMHREGAVNAGPLPDTLREHVLQSAIDERLLLLEAKALHIEASTAAVALEMDTWKRSYPKEELDRALFASYQTEEELAKALSRRWVADQVVARQVLAGLSVSEEDLRQSFDTLPPGERTVGPRVHAAQIMVRTESEGRAVLEQLGARNADFAAIARRSTVAPEASRGGDLGWLSPGDLPKSLEEACFILEPGQLSPLVVSEYGFHVLKVLEKEPARALGFEEARPMLQKKLLETRARAARKLHMEALRARYRIEIDEPYLNASAKRGP